MPILLRSGILVSAIFALAVTWLSSSWTARNIHGVTGDEVHYLITASGLFEDGTFEQSRAYRTEFQTRRFYPGELQPLGSEPDPTRVPVIPTPRGIFSTQAPGLPLLLSVPVGLHGVRGAKALMALFGILAVFLLHSFSAFFFPRSGWPRFVAVGILVLGLPFLPAATQIYPELPAAVICLWALLAYFRPTPNECKSRDFFLGFGLAFLPWLQAKFLFASLLLIGAFVIERIRARRWVSLAVFLAPVLVTFLALAAYNRMVFGSSWGPPASDLASLARAGLAALGLHFDRNQGFFLQNPAFWMGLVFLVPFFRTFGRRAWLWLALYLAFLLPSAWSGNFYGGWSFVGRYAWPLALLFAVPAVYGWSRLIVMRPRLAGSLAGAAFALQVVRLMDYRSGAVELYNRLAAPQLPDEPLFFPRLASVWPRFSDETLAFSLAPNVVILVVALVLLGIGFALAKGGVTDTADGDDLPLGLLGAKIRAKLQLTLDAPLKILLALAAAGVLTLQSGRIKTSVFVGCLALVALVGAFLERRFGARQLQPRLTAKQLRWVLLVAVLGFCVRLPWFPHHVGGQDQGLYVSMAQAMWRNQSLSYPDQLDPQMTQEQKDLYNAGGGAKLTGTNLADIPHGWTIPFYPLFPFLMGAFSKISGAESQGIFHILLSSLAFVAFLQLALRLGLGFGYALWTAALAYFIPAVVWVSRMPYTETLALFINLTSYGFLLAWVRSLATRENGEHPPIDWVAGFWSLIAFNAFCYTRMTMPVQGPFLSFVFFGVFAFVRDPKRRAIWAVFGILILLSFTTSLPFYKKDLRLLYESGWVNGLRNHIGATPEQVDRRLLGIGLLGTMLIGGLIAWRKLQEQMRRSGRFFGLFAKIFLGLSLVFLLHQGIELCGRGISEHDFWKEPPSAKIFSRVVFYRIFLWLTPFGFAILAWFLGARRLIPRWSWALCLLFTALQAIIFSLFESVMYSFYADRYFVSELIPSFVLVVGIGAWMIREQIGSSRLLKGLMAGALAVSVGFSVVYVGRAEGSYGPFHRQLNRMIPPNSVVIYLKKEMPLGGALMTPLVYFYGMKVFPILKIEDLRSKAIQTFLQDPTTPVYLVANSGLTELIQKEGDWSRADRLTYNLGFWINGPHAWAQGDELPNPWMRWLPPLEYKTYEHIIGVWPLKRGL